MKKLFLILLIILSATAVVIAQELEISGTLKSQNSVGVETGDFHEIKESLNLDLEYGGEKGGLLVSPYLIVDPLATAGDKPEWGVREAYIDIFTEFIDLRVGKQAVFWGQAEGAFITDIVSPQNLNSFILSDFEEIRIGVPALKATAYLGPVTLEGIWIQKFIPTILPAEGTLWHTDLMPDLSAVDLPETNLENSEVFGRASYFGSLLTLELVGGYACNDLPVAEGSPMAPDLVYHRSLIFGGILSTAIGPFGIRAEGAVTLDKPFSTLQTGMPPVIAVENHHFIQGLIGVDGTVLGFNLSTQYILQYIDEFNSTLINQKEMLHTATLRIQRKFLDERLTASLFSYVGFDPLDSLLRPEVSYWIEDGLEVALGADIFLGEPEGRFGVHEGKSQVTASLSWYF